MDLDDELRATELVRDATQRWPDREVINGVAGWMAALRGDQQATVRYGRKILETAPGHPLGVYLLNYVDVTRGDYTAARARFAAYYPELFVQPPPEDLDVGVAISLAAIFLKTSEPDQARALLDRCAELVRARQRLGARGYGIDDARIHALRGERTKALQALRAAVKEGWRGPFWRVQPTPVVQSFQHGPYGPLEQRRCRHPRPAGIRSIVFSSSLSDARRRLDSIEFQCVFMTYTSHGRMITSCFGVDEASVVQLNPETLEVYDHYELPIVPPEEATSLFDAQGLNGLSASYIFFDKDERFFNAVKDEEGKNWIIVLVEGGSDASPTLELEQEYDMSKWVSADNRPNQQQRNQLVPPEQRH